MLEERLKKTVCSSVFVFVVCGLLGGLFFIHTYGVAILDFTYTEWCLDGLEDMPQHYLGWAMFRNSDWYFPVGLMDNIVYPFKESVVYTDSIPLFAIIFKLFSPVLPTDFQYFGLFGLLVYVLQGAVAGLIVKKLTGSTLYSVIGSGFFILSTVMAWRMYYHTSLSSHFIILLCIYIGVSKTGVNSIAKNTVLWGGLLVLSALIHLYFVPMVLIFMFFYLLDDYFQVKKLRDLLIVFAISFALLFAAMFVSGAFYSHADKASIGLGFFSTNLNSLFNSLEMSGFLKSLPVIFAQYDGNAYVGLGVILGIVMLISVTLKMVSLKEIFANTTLFRRAFFVVSIISLFYIFALSPTITMGRHILFTYPIPGFVEYLWSIFRGTGRMIWPVVYIVMTLMIWGVFKFYKIKIGLLLLFLLLIVQHRDLNVYFANKGDSFKNIIEWKTALPSAKWNDLFESHKHILFMQDGFFERDNRKILYSIMNLAILHNLTINDSYLARKNTSVINNYKKDEGLRIRRGEAKDDAIYLFETSEAAELYAAHLHLYSIDGVIIGLKEEYNFKK
jgi:hypothetical protein